MPEKTHWKKLNNPDYLGAYAFNPGEEKTVTISAIKREIVTGPDGKKEECTVVSFAGNTKPLILNATNAKMIQKLFKTPYIEDWTGKSITLVVETVSAFGERVEAVRVKKKAPNSPGGTACEDCGQIIISTGGFTAAQIIQAGINRYNRPVCMECANALKEAVSKPEIAEKELEEQANENNAD